VAVCIAESTPFFFQKSISLLRVHFQRLLSFKDKEIVEGTNRLVSFFTTPPKIRRYHGKVFTKFYFGKKRGVQRQTHRMTGSDIVKLMGVIRSYTDCMVM
jgi:hypothetical protein